MCSSRLSSTLSVTSINLGFPKFSTYSAFSTKEDCTVAWNHELENYWGNRRNHVVCFSSFKDYYSSLSIVQCLKPFFICFNWLFISGKWVNMLLSFSGFVFNRIFTYPVPHLHLSYFCSFKCYLAIYFKSLILFMNYASSLFISAWPYILFDLFHSFFFC